MKTNNYYKQLILTTLTIHPARRRLEQQWSAGLCFRLWTLFTTLYSVWGKSKAVVKISFYSVK